MAGTVVKEKDETGTGKPIQLVQEPSRIESGTETQAQLRKPAPPVVRGNASAAAGARATGTSTAGSAVPKAAVTAEQAQATKRITLG